MKQQEEQKTVKCDMLDQIMALDAMEITHKLGASMKMKTMTPLMSNSDKNNAKP